MRERCADRAHGVRAGRDHLRPRRPLRAASGRRRGGAVAWRPAARRRAPCRSPGAGAPGSACGLPMPRTTPTSPSSPPRLSRRPCACCAVRPASHAPSLALALRGWALGAGRRRAAVHPHRALASEPCPTADGRMTKAEGQYWWWPAAGMWPRPRRWTRCCDMAWSSCARRSRISGARSRRRGANGGARGRHHGDGDSSGPVDQRIAGGVCRSGHRRRPACVDRGRRVRPRPRRRTRAHRRRHGVGCVPCPRIRQPVADWRTSARHGHRDADWRRSPGSPHRDQGWRVW